MWAIIFLLLAGFFIKIAVFEHHYYQSKEGVARQVPVVVDVEPIDEEKPTETVVEQYTVGPALPRYLSIQKLGIVNARIIQVGIRANGELGTPNNIYDIGWYNASGTPGMGGTLLLDGHNGGPTTVGVLKYLPELATGDIVTVERGDGAVFNYEVVENRTIPLSEATAYMQTAQKSPVAGKESLTIITCTGDWSAARQTYLSRQFLRAVLK